MAEVLAIDWAATRVCGVQADVSPGSLKIQNSFSFDVPEGMSDPAELGPWLQKELKAARISAKSVLLSVPREEVVVRHMELPPVDEAELPELVRFQAASKSTIPLDQLALDFLPLKGAEWPQAREVLVASMNRQRIKDVRATITAAGLELSSVGVSSIAAVHLVSETPEERGAGADELSLILARHGDRIELSILGQGNIYSSHSTQVDSVNVAQSQNAILADISRSMIALLQRLPDARIARAWILGSPGEDSDLAAGIHERFQCPLHRIDPFNAQGLTVATEPGDESHAAYVGPIGMLLGRRYESERTLDFLNPRRPAVKRDYTQIKRGGIAAAVVVGIFGVFVVRGMMVSGLEADAEAAQKETESKKKMLEELQPQDEVADNVDERPANRVDWLHYSTGLAHPTQGTDRQRAEGRRVG
ncbi:MAG: pilus assembly protein PilM [Planctomycetes bacterium]|nr:pilus assembly protein PilM [Planctomycetota bacterium]